MSHFSLFTTNLKKKKLLLQCLKDLNIHHLKKNKNIIIIQKNFHRPKFIFDKNIFRFNFDLEFWKQSLPFEVFIQSLQQKYNYYYILNQSKKINFLVTEKAETIYKKKLILQRYIISNPLV
jgi:hypothetical protein